MCFPQNLATSKEYFAKKNWKWAVLAVCVHHTKIKNCFWKYFLDLKIAVAQSFEFVSEKNSEIELCVVGDHAWVSFLYHVFENLLRFQHGGFSRMIFNIFWFNLLSMHTIKDEQKKLTELLGYEFMSLN